MKHEIINRFTGGVLFSCEVGDAVENKTKFVLLEAIKSGADLRGADLRGADLRGADLRHSNLRGADLRGADLRGADLRGADLRGADLRHSNLRHSNLRGADLRGADLRGADLRGAKNAPLLITTLDWLVSIDGLGMMRIGCQNHSVSSWASFTNDEISEMDSYALEFWNKHKVMLLSICDSYKHGEENASS